MGLTGKEEQREQREEDSLEGESFDRFSCSGFLSSFSLSWYHRGSYEDLTRSRVSRTSLILGTEELACWTSGGRKESSSTSFPSFDSPTSSPNPPFIPLLAALFSGLTHASLSPFLSPRRPRLRLRGGGSTEREGVEESSRAGGGSSSYLFPPTELRGLRKKLSSLLLGSSKGKERAAEDEGGRTLAEEYLRGGRSGAKSLFR